MDGERSFNPLWVERYRPRKVSDVILPEDIKSVFQKCVDNGTILNMTASGTPGVGKTTIMKAMIEELDADHMFLNASLKGNIDTLRNEIQEFSSSVSLTGRRKYVILDEADNITLAAQDGLRGIIERYNSTGFLFTCNRAHKISDAILSRAPITEFRIRSVDKPSIAAQFFKRACNILDQEKVKYEKPVVAEVVKKLFPDFRRILNELQRYSYIGPIDDGIIVKLNMSDMTTLFSDMKSKNFTAVRKWVGENADNDAAIYRKLYDKASEVVTASSVPVLILALAEYSYRSAFVADKEVNMAACFAQIMAEVDFK